MKFEKNRRVKGSVLFTVVSVMSLLIIFLMGTLVLAASANNRAHKSYSSSQTQYTARTAVDSILAAIGDSSTDGKALATAIGKLKSVSDPPIEVQVDVGNSSLGRVTKATISLVDPNHSIYDSDAQKWVSCKKYAITAQVEIGGAVTTMTSYVLQDAPAATNPGGNPVGFMTRGDFDGSNHTSAFGGMYVGIGYDWNSKEYIGTDDNTGIPYTLADKRYLTNKTYAVGNGNTVESPMFVDGNLYSNVPIDIIIPRKGEGITIWGDLSFQNNGLSVHAVNLSNSDKYTFNEVPYIYVDGKIICPGSDFKLGSGTGNNGDFPMNVFCGSIVSSNAGFDAYADIYCLDKYSVKTVGGNKVEEGHTVLSGNPSNLYNWSASVVKGGTSYSNFGGNFYSKGNLTIKDNTATFGKVGSNIQVCVEGDVTISKDTNIHGDLIVGGNLAINTDKLNVTGKIYAKTVSGAYANAGVKTEKPGVTMQVTKQPTMIHVKNAGIRENEHYVAPNELWLKADALADPALSAVFVDKGTYYDMNNFVIRDLTDAAAPDYYATYYLKNYQDWTDDNVKDDGEYVYKDKNGKVINEYEMFEMSDMEYTGNNPKDVNPISDYLKPGVTIYPDYAEKEIILGLEQLMDGGTPVPIAETHVVKTVRQKMEELGTDNNIVTTCPTSVDDNVYDSSDKLPVDATGKVVITESCTLADAINGSEGMLKNSDATITITPDGKTLWIKLKDVAFSNGVKIIVDDTAGGHVNFFVEGKVTFAGNGSRLVTKTYSEKFDSGEEIWITSDPVNMPIPAEKAAYAATSPNITIYSSKNMKQEIVNGEVVDKPVNQLQISNLFLMTAYIEAPYMLFEGGDFGSITNTIYYNNAKVNDYMTTGRSNFGCAICQVGTFTNDWTNYYIPDGATSVTPPVHSNGLGKHTYQAVDYFAY